MKRAKRNKRVRLPDGTWLPLVYSVPDAQVCRTGDPRHCQHAEGLRAAGFRDPQVMPGDRFIVKAVYGKYRLVFALNARTVTSIAKFDAKAAEPSGQVHILPRPISITEIVRRGPRKAKRRDAGMTKKEADKRFRRKAGKNAGRRAHTIKFAA